MVDKAETLGGALEDVRAFCAVVELGTVTAAARRLGETKGSLSRRLTRLERRLGTTLLARTPRAVSPTEEGLAFYAKAREALTWLDDAVESARLSQQKPQGHLRLTAPVDLGIDVLPPLVTRFRQRHPQITVDLLLTDAPLDLAANRIDLALRASVGELPDMSYRASLVARFYLRLYAAPAYLTARGTPAVPTALIGHDLVAPRELIGGNARPWLTDRRGRTLQAVVRPVICTSDYASALRLIAAGGGIDPLPELVAAAAVAAGTIVPVLSQWHVSQGTLYAISLGGRAAPARVRVFRDFVRRELAALAGT